MFIFSLQKVAALGDELGKLKTEAINSRASSEVANCLPASFLYFLVLILNPCPSPWLEY